MRTFASAAHAEHLRPPEVALEVEGDAAGRPDAYVLGESEAPYAEMGDPARSEHDAGRLAAVRSS